MNTKELAFAKHGALSAKKWDTFQAVIRKCLKHLGSADNKKQRILSSKNHP